MLVRTVAFQTCGLLEDDPMAMKETTRLSEAKRRLLDQYLCSDRGQDQADGQAIPPRPTRGPIPLSFSQQQVWLHSHMVGDVPVYNEAITIYRRGPLDDAVLERCLTEILRRHEIWRTIFDTVDGKPVQVVQAAPEHFRLRSIDLRKMCKADRVREAVRLATEDARKPFDLKKGPLLRATLVRIEEEVYRLYVTFHQIVFDAICAYRVFLPELATLYEAFIAGKASPLPEPSLQYGDFAYWQQKNWNVSSGSEQLLFWREKLSGAPPILQMPVDRARSAGQTPRGAVQRFEFKADLIPPLRAFCRQEHVSAYMTLLASYAALLSRYTRQDDIVIGGLSAGRKRSELQRVVGYFVNPVALRLDLSGNPTFRELTSRVRNTVLDALAHEEVPFQHVVEALQLRPDPSYNPIFQLIFSLQPPMPAVSSEWELATEEVSSGGSKVDLTIVVDERADGISGPITYNPDLFDASTITRIVDHWQRLLAGALACPDRRISGLPLLKDTERQQLLVDWNETQVNYPQHKCLHELIDAQVERTPNTIALKFEDKQMTYGELDARSDRLAHHLRSLGVRPNMAVGLYFERSLEMVIASLGVLRAGAVCLPLDPSYPHDRLSYMLAETRATVLLTQARLKAHLPCHSARVLCIDTDLQLGSIKRTIPIASSVSPDSLAYIIYTSGSTGHAKGVQVTHKGLVNSTMARTTYYHDPVCSFLLLSSFAFDSSLAGIFWTLSTGGTLVLPPDQSRWDLRGLIELIAGHRISHLLCTPSLYRQFLDESTPGQLSSLRVAIVAGEECPKELVDQHYSLLPHTALFNEYGPTEGTVWSTVHHCETDLRSTRVPIGKPIANVQLYVLDSYLQPVPVGVTGELHIAGAGVTQGYLNSPKLTAHQFVSNPFSSQPGACFYKTGDVARYLPDGSLEWLGRLDTQIKIRGFRVELEEIEAVITGFKGVRQAVVDLKRSNNTLIAYLVTNPGFIIDDLRSFLRRKLLEVMIPTAFVQLKSLPMLPNGKIDRQALPAPEQPKSETEYVAPKDEIESNLIEIWQAILETTPIGVTDNFFDLGGHSLTMVKLIARIERVFRRKLSIRDIVEACTIQKLAALLRNEKTSSNNPAIVPIQPRGSKPPLFWVRGGPLFVPLARSLGLNQPLLGLDLPLSEASQLSVTCNLEDIAAALVRLMRIEQPEGPYHLAGLCVNGVIAYEMAYQLSNQGQQVALLALFDAQNPEYYRDFSREGRARLLLNKTVFHVSKLRRLRGTREKLRFICERLVSMSRKLRVLRWQAHHALRLRISEQQLENLDLIVHPASYGYRPKPYSGRVVFFQSTDWPSGRYWDFHASWTGLVAGMETYYIPGGHESMFHQPNVNALASRLGNCLSGAQRSPVVVRVATDKSSDAIMDDKLSLNCDSKLTIQKSNGLAVNSLSKVCRIN